MRYGQDNSVFANMDMYRIENVVCYPFRTATLVDNETIEGQIGEGCRVRSFDVTVFPLSNLELVFSSLRLSKVRILADLAKESIPRMMQVLIERRVVGISSRFDGQFGWSFCLSKDCL